MQNPGVGVTKQISSIQLFPNFSTLSKHTLYIEYYVYIWQVSPHLTAAVRSVKYESDSKNLTDTFAISKTYFKEKWSNGALVTTSLV